ncbi:pilus assembly protein, partial [Ideonella sp.]|uniref:pilus assembly protein n=1 Tax=Ideonella sp. TaxID=1929293 RepID=UPI0037BEF04B
NHRIPQRALNHQTPIEALKKWHASHPKLFTKRVNDLPGLDTYSPQIWPDWASGHGYIGTKIYTANETGIGCFDFATNASCGSYQGSAPMAVYNTRTDPTRPGCIMALGDVSVATIIDGNTWKPCSSGVTGVLPDLEVNPQDYYACDVSRSRVTGWREVRISNSIAWGGANGLRSVALTLKDGQGRVLPDVYKPTRSFAEGSYNLSIADIPYSLYPKLTIGLKMESTGAFPKVAFGADVTWDGDPQQVCVSTKISSQPNCQLNSALVVETKVIGQPTSTPAETLSVATVLSPGGLSSGYSAVATPTSPRAVLSDLGARDPKTYVVQGRWALQHFSGDLWAFGLGPNGQIDGSSYLSAQAATAVPSARPMFAATPGAGVQPVKNLDWTLLSDGQRQALNLDLGGVADTKGSARLDYLRGSDGGFRARSGKSLGPVISSSPAMLLPAATLGLDERSHPGYTAYRATVTRPHPIALLGGNDGALHAYEVRPGSLKEAWSFVPDAMLRRAANYADASLAGIRANPYFVDNIPMVGHANTTGQADGWRAVAVVTYGRGARAITALDVTRSDLSQGDGVLFEYSNTSDPELKDLGYIISQPVSNNAMVSQQIVQLGKDSERRAAVLVGNGINSNDGEGGAAASGTGKAVLYAFYLDRGERRWQRWAVDELWAGADSDPGLKTNNGLSTPTPVDVDGDGRIDLAYAGDLQGNLWRFDIRNPGAASVTRLFKTEAQQPITQAPFVSVNTQATGCGSTEANAATSAKRCWQVVFSTGAAISPLIGSPNVATQSLYGVLDKGRGASLVRGQLTAIPFEVNTLLNGVEYRALKPTTVNYKGGALGWTIDLQAFEHGVGAPRQQPTGLVMFSSIRPTTPDRAINVCIGPRSWLNEVDPINGYSALVPFDTNGDGNIDGQDRINPDSNSPLSPAGMAVSGAQFGPPALLLAASTQAQQMSLLLPSLGQDTGQVNSWSGGVPPGGSATPGQNSTALTHANKTKLGRMSWREVY